MYWVVRFFQPKSLEVKERKVNDLNCSSIQQILVKSADSVRSFLGTQAPDVNQAGNIFILMKLKLCYKH